MGLGHFRWVGMWVEVYMVSWVVEFSGDFLKY